MKEEDEKRTRIGDGEPLLVDVLLLSGARFLRRRHQIHRYLNGEGEDEGGEKKRKEKEKTEDPKETTPEERGRRV